MYPSLKFNVQQLVLEIMKKKNLKNSWPFSKPRTLIIQSELIIRHSSFIRLWFVRPRLSANQFMFYSSVQKTPTEKPERKFQNIVHPRRHKSNHAELIYSSITNFTTLSSTALRSYSQMTDITAPDIFWKTWGSSAVCHRTSNHLHSCSQR